MKQNWLFLVILLVVYTILTYPLPYYIYTGGGTIDITDRVQVEHGYEVDGSMSFAYVSELRGTIPTYLLSFLFKDWKLEKIEDYKLNENETTEDVLFRDKLSLQEANQTAIALAYQKAGKDFIITNNHLYIIYVAEEALTDIKVGDELLSVDGKKYTTIEEYRSYIQEKEIGATLSMQVKRDKKEKTVSVKVQNMNGEKLTGLSFSNIYDYETDPKVSLHFKNQESGPSGGLMLTLSIYNQLVKDDITKGKKIVGTGTIEEDGTVGAIGGVTYKLRGAVKAKADIFLVPNGENYEDCIALQKERGYSIKIIGVSTFEEALTALESLS